MEPNPYASPTADTRGTTIDYRVFEVKSFTLSLRSPRDEARRRALQAIDEIGAENVISIVEHGGAFENFSVVVWYRVPAR